MKNKFPDILLATAELINPTKIVAFYTIMFMVSFPKIHGVQVIYGLIQNIESTQVDYIVFGKWLFVISTPIIIAGRFFELCKQLEVFIRIRMPRDRIYRIYILINCEILYFLWAIWLCIGAMFFDDTWKGLQLITVLIPNYLLWGSMQTLLYIYFDNKKSIAILIGLISGTCLYALHKPEISCYLPVIWGMLESQESMQGRIFKGIISILFCVLISIFCITRKEQG